MVSVPPTTVPKTRLAGSRDVRHRSRVDGDGTRAALAVAAALWRAVLPAASGARYASRRRRQAPAPRCSGWRRRRRRRAANRRTPAAAAGAHAGILCRTDRSRRRSDRRAAERTASDRPGRRWTAMAEMRLYATKLTLEDDRDVGAAIVTVRRRYGDARIRTRRACTSRLKRYADAARRCAARHARSGGENSERVRTFVPRASDL